SVSYAAPMDSLLLHADSYRSRQRFADRGGGFCYADAAAFQRFDLFRGSSLPAGDDGSGVAHAAARRRGLAGDESDSRLLHVRLDELGGGFFGVAADFADHDD